MGTGAADAGEQLRSGEQDRSGGPLLLDREAELDRLRALLVAARAGDGAVAVLEGPPGIGKTALLTALTAHARGAGFQVLSARGDEMERGFAYGVARQLFEPTIAELEASERDELLTGAASLAAPLVDPSHEPHPERQTGDEFPLFHGLYWLAARLAERTPLGIIVDDAHWADRPSLRWLRYLTRRLEGITALVAIATRSTRPEAPVAEIDALKTAVGVTLLEPQPLHEIASGALLRQVLDTDPAPELVRTAYEATAGNPFLLRELGRSLVADRIPPDADAAGRLAELKPDTIVHGALRRLASLDPDARELARSAAVLGQDAQVRHAAALAGLDESAALGAADLLVAAGFLAPAGLHDSRLVFAHPLMRQVLEADLAPGERAARHKAAARLFASEPGASEHAAAHLLRTAPSSDPSVVSVLRAAAAVAHGAGAPDSAATYLRRALDEPPTDQDRPAVLLELGRAEAQTADPRAGARLEEAARIAPEVHQRAAALGRLAFTRFHQSNAVAAFKTAREALDQLPPGSGGESEAWLLTTTLWGARAVPDLVDEASVLLQESRTGPYGEPTAAELARVAFQAHDDLLRGRRPDAEERLAWITEQPRELLEAKQAPTGFTLGVVQAFVDQGGQAEATLTHVLECARRRGDKMMMGVLDLLAYLRWRRGDLTGGIADADTMLGLFEQLDEGEWAQPTRWITIMRALCLTDRGDLDAAGRALALPEELEARRPDTWWWAWLLFARGRLALARGDWLLARRQALAAGDRLRAIQICSPHYMEWRSLAAEAMARQGDADPAMALVRDELELARGEGSPRANGVALRTLGLIQGGDEGLATLEEATSVLSTDAARLEHARALYEFGSALRRANRRADAREPLQQAMDLARSCGAVPLAERAHAELRATGARPRRLVFTGVEALTPRERQVAELAAEGRSNPEIAQALFVTRKTVETHLGAVYRKLGASARGQLGDVLGIEPIFRGAP